MIAFATFRLDRDTRCVWRFTDDRVDCRVPLTPRAFEMLQYLTDRAGRLVTHDELLDALWRDLHVQPEVLKTHMFSIRTALGDDPRSPRFIETHRGRGYRFIAPLQTTSARSLYASRQIVQNAFVGRTPQLQTLNDLLEEVRRGATRIVFVSGESGIGKTELVSRFLNSLTDDATILTSIGRCIAGYGGMEDYYPVLLALTKLVRGPAGTLIARTLTSVAPSWAWQIAAWLPRECQEELNNQIGLAASERMLREICGFLEALTREQPLVMILDDLHHADYRTVDILSAMARQDGEARILIVATYCAEAAAILKHPLPSLNAELRLKGLSRNIVLEPLSETAVADYVSCYAPSLDALTTPDLVGFLRERSGGNPRFLAATLEQLTDMETARSAFDAGSANCVQHLSQLAVPASLGEAIEDRFRRLSDVQQRILNIASVAAQPFNATSVAAVAVMSQTEVESICDTLCAQGSFIRRVPNPPSAQHRDSGSYNFRHVMYRQTLYERQGLLGLGCLQTRLAQTLVTAPAIEASGEINTTPNACVVGTNRLDGGLH